MDGGTLPATEDALKTFLSTAGVVRDFVDLRDQPYVPTLQPLRAQFDVNPVLFMGGKRPGQFDFGVRDQGTTGRCVGYAMATVIDIQRRLQSASAGRHAVSLGQRVSADMLYHMARFHEPFGARTLEDDPRNALSEPAPMITTDRGDTGVRTLRSVLKGFYHHGVCCEARDLADADPSCWTPLSMCGPGGVEAQFPSVLQAKAARKTTLGAYYRLSHFLNHYHAAINETGCVLVSALLHDGWMADAVSANGGRIAWKEGGWGAEYSHAFVIVGYTDEGFLVLNSWGPDWGGFEAQVGTKDAYKIPGVALWSYADWAENILDGWVLRLGVSAPAAFDVSVGEQGQSMAGLGNIRAGSTPCLELLGHFLHLDDGLHVESGPYPTPARDDDGRTGIRATCTYLDQMWSAGDGVEECPYDGILLRIPGTVDGMAYNFERSVQQKKRIKALKLYPYTLFWCSDFVEEAVDVMRGIFRMAQDQAGKKAPHLRQLMEQRVRGIGRAFWRDIEASARHAVRGREEDFLPPSLSEAGPAADMFARLLDVADKHGKTVHVICEGAGALVLDELLAIMERDWRRQDGLKGGIDWAAAYPALGTISLAMPTITLERATERLRSLVASLNEKMLKRGAAKDLVPRARIFVPDAGLEERVHLAEYQGSVTHLVANAFIDRLPDGSAQTLLGMAGAVDDFPTLEAGKGKPSTKLRRGTQKAFTTFSLDRDTGPGPVDQRMLTEDPGLMRSILDTIRADLTGRS
ncbi:MAG: C1 family peptidase [Pseudomonadota bacterium]